MDIVYEDDKIMVINKVAGKFTQSSRPQNLDLVSEVLTYRSKKRELPYISLINRLDVPVSGLVLLAKTREEAGRLNQQMREGGFSKKYYAAVCGIPEQEQGRLTDYVLKDTPANMSYVVEKGEPGSKLAELDYEVIKIIREPEYAYTLLKIHLITGRHHQIRVQFSSRGMPILGDVKYGGESVESYLSHSQKEIALRKSEIALCAYELTVDDTTFTVKPKWYME